MKRLIPASSADSTVSKPIDGSDGLDRHQRILGERSVRPVRKNGRGIGARGEADAKFRAVSSMFSRVTKYGDSTSRRPG